MIPIMDSPAILRSEEASHTAAQASDNLHEERLWGRARLNLMLLYGGRRDRGVVAEVNPSGKASGPLASGSLG
jgi:hypothetical protein